MSEKETFFNGRRIKHNRGGDEQIAPDSSSIGMPPMIGLDISSPLIAPHPYLDMNFILTPHFILDLIHSSALALLTESKNKVQSVVIWMRENEKAT
jgi:hypothetical protein